MIIDWQHHFIPQEMAVRKGENRFKPSQPVYTEKGQVHMHFRPELYELVNHLEFMDASGIDIAVLSTPRCLTLEECKIANDALAGIMKKHPDRFIGLASFIPTKGDESLKELDRAINILGLKGVCIDAQMEGHNIDSKILWPFYETVSRLDIPIFVHIAGTRHGLEALESQDYNLWVTLSTMVLDLLATFRILLGGVLVEFPDLKIVISHMGGGISAIKERLDRYIDKWGQTLWTDLGGTSPFHEPLAQNFGDCFNKLYFDMAGYEGGMSAVRCALMNISPERLLFATDYPLNFTGEAAAVAEYIKNIRRLDVPAGSVEAMLGVNAANILHIR